MNKLITLLAFLTISEGALALDIMKEHELNIIKQRANLNRSTDYRSYKYIELDAEDIEVVDGVITVEGLTEDDQARHMELGIKIDGDIDGEEISIGDSEVSERARSINSNIIIDGTIESDGDVSVGNVEIDNPHVDSLEINSLIKIEGDISSGH